MKDFAAASNKDFEKRASHAHAYANQKLTKTEQLMKEVENNRSKGHFSKTKCRITANLQSMTNKEGILTGCEVDYYTADGEIDYEHLLTVLKTSKKACLRRQDRITAQRKNK